mmetsp:Transcript_17499/g.19677  ORF Transcript_17499/g.19677 Transcript_17499/m.19677 type:complete len:99 (-) Transcript_17499:172-468(-)
MKFESQKNINFKVEDLVKDELRIMKVKETKKPKKLKSMVLQSPEKQIINQMIDKALKSRDGKINCRKYIQKSNPDFRLNEDSIDMSDIIAMEFRRQKN